MLTTKRNLRQARAVSARGRNGVGSPAGHWLRVGSAAAVITLVFSLSPSATQAPIRADEPIGGTVTQASLPMAPAAGVDVGKEALLPPTRPGPIVADAPATPVQRPENREGFLEFVRKHDLAGLPPFYSAYPSLRVLDILTLQKQHGGS